MDIVLYQILILPLIRVIKMSSIAFTSTNQFVPFKPADGKSWCREVCHARSTSRMNSLLFEVTRTLCLWEMAKAYPRFSELLVICLLYLCHSTCCCSLAELWGYDGELDMTEIPLPFLGLRVYSIIWSLKERKETQKKKPLEFRAFGPQPDRFEQMSKREKVILVLIGTSSKSRG